ncbi:MAG: hypothetical protein H7Z12_07715 [Rhodospirillaceae bacterium]|nr:hypothetical protein [Rhodospirillales bacterium]
MTGLKAAADRHPSTALNRLKRTLLALPDTGPKGFEGLIGALLGAVSHASFRLAASGSQDGQDGRGDGPAGAISFEAKLYGSKLTKAVINNKATEILASPAPPDVWVLAATVGVTTQIIGTLSAAFTRTETSLVVLDWPDNDPLPPLALLCAIAREPLVNFLRLQLKKSSNIDQIKKDLAGLADVPGFAERAAEMRAMLSSPMLGAPLALDANRAMFRTVFSHVDRARHRFGQPLAPAASFALSPVDRPGRATLDEIFRTPPETELVVIIGDQGCGKSWSVAQAWLAQADPPLMIFLTASEAVAAQPSAPQSLIARCLVEQSGGVVTDEALRRWERRLSQWACHHATSPRLVVVIDGLNERARTDWAPWLSRLTLYLASISGRVIATSRARYFQRIEDRLSVPYRKIPIGDFSDGELDEVLARHNICATQIASRVRPSLRNPRILGIALDLLSDEQIRTAEELSIERLLFEHLRRNQSEQDTGHAPFKYTRLLGEHARLIRERIESQVAQDRLIFDSYDHKDAPHYDLPRDLLPVVEERFFEALSDDQSLYRLTDDGLVFALGIATIRELQAAERNGRPVAERLADIIEPVAALDKVTDVLFAAALLASVDRQISDSIGGALVSCHATQQNADEETYPAYCGIVRNRPGAALDALFSLDTTTRHAQHKDWLIMALRQARDDKYAWPEIAGRADQWLRLYSLNPAHGPLPGDDDAAKRAKALEDTQKKIATRLVDLSPCERALVDEKLVRDDNINSVSLSEDAFLIIAGRPLAPFAEALMCWAFARALNSCHRVPWDDYRFVVQHNWIDWFKTRDALLAAGACFARDGASRTARWALVTILRATGHAEDGDRAEALAETLIEDWQRFKGWRRIEDYCATDPCDPGSDFPENIEETAQRYAALSPTELMVNRGYTEKEHFLQDAAPGLARFSPECAVKLTRAISAELIKRPSEVVILATNWLSSTAVLLDPTTINASLKRAAELSHPMGPISGKANNDWVVSQYLLLATLPHLDGDAQTAVIRGLPEHGPPLLQLRHVFRPASPTMQEALIDHAVQSQEEHRLLTTLAFVHWSGSHLSSSVLDQIRHLTTHFKPSVRGLAMQISAKWPDRAHLANFVASGWTATKLDPREDFLERWHGSSMILAAAELGLLSPPEAIARIIPGRYDDAVRRLGKQYVGKSLATLLSNAVACALEVTLPFNPPRVSHNNEGHTDDAPLFSLEDDNEILSVEERFKRLNESGEEFLARQQRGWDRFRAFQSAITAASAELILSDIGSSALAAVAECAPSAVNAIAQQILNLKPTEFPRIVNLSLRFARILSSSDPETAVALFRASEGHEGFIRITRTSGKIPLRTWEAWHSAPSETMQRYWKERLNEAATDHDLACEVLAASYAGKQAFLEVEAERAMATEHPVAMARALMILGYCDESTVAASIIPRFAGRAGLVGKAAKAAQYAYERNVWSRVWFDRLAMSDDPVNFWRYATLLAKIVDARVGLWSSRPAAEGLLGRFAWSLDKPMRSRIEDWKKKRSDKLFGADRPNGIYLTRHPDVRFETLN